MTGRFFAFPKQVDYENLIIIYIIIYIIIKLNFNKLSILSPFTPIECFRKSHPPLAKTFLS